MHPRRVQPDEERLAVRLRPSMKSVAKSRMSSSTVSMLYLMPSVGCGGSGPSSTIRCLPTLPQRGSTGGVVGVGGEGMHEVARSDLVDQVLRIARPEGSDIASR